MTIEQFNEKVLKKYADTHEIPPRSPEDLSPLEKWLLINLHAVSIKLANQSKTTKQ
jgi:hypothetical protein